MAPTEHAARWRVAIGTVAEQLSLARCSPSVWLAWCLADLLPRRVVHFALVRAMAHATTGRYYRSDAILRLRALELLERWDGQGRSGR